MISREDFREFAQALWASTTSDGPHEPAMLLGLRALRIYTGEETLLTLLTNPDAIIKELEEARSHSIPVSDPLNPNSAFSRRSHGSVAAERTREFHSVWKNSPPLPRPVRAPAEQPPAAIDKMVLPVCVECKQPFTIQHDGFIPGSPIGVCCGDKVIARNKR